MKTNTVIFCALLSLIAIQSKSPDTILNTPNRPGRTPANTTDPVDPLAKKAEPCKSELKGEKLASDVKKLIEDKEEVLKVIELPKAKKEESKKATETAEVKSDNSEVLALMTQMTSLFTTQMQMQMQMQTQMMNMILQMQSNIMPQANPYAQQFYPTNNMYGGYSSFNDNFNLRGNEVGIGSAQPSQWSHNSNPYSAIPAMDRNQSYPPSEYGFSFDRAPAAQTGFDFNQSSVSI